LSPNSITFLLSPMLKVKIKISFSQLEALYSLLSDFNTHRKSCCRHDLERLLVATVQLLMARLYVKKLFAFAKDKTFSFSIAEGFAIVQAMRALNCKNEYGEAVRITVIMELEKQLPR